MRQWCYRSVIINQISNEKMKALTELKNHVADLSIEMAEKVLRELTLTSPTIE